MPNRFAPVLTSAAWLIASAALAQPSATPDAPASNTVAPLTVHAAPSTALMRSEARAFVQTYAAPTPELDQLARWNDPICIQVSGLTPDQAVQVARRIGQVAEGVGMRMLPPGCTANIEVVFTDQPQRFMDRVADSREEVLGYYHRHDRDRLKAVTRPIQAWYVTSTFGAGNGGGVQFQPTSGDAAPKPGVASVQSHTEVVDDPENPRPAACGDSPHFTRCLSSVLTNVLVVVDASRVRNQDLGLVADYLSLLALSRPRSLDGCTALSSVIDALSPACQGRPAPDGLTPADAAYLTSLYATDLEATGMSQEGDIAGRMASILTRPSGGS